MIDIFITTKGRQNQFVKSLSSLNENTDRNLYRLTVVDDGGEHESEATLDAYHNHRSRLPDVDHWIRHHQNMGLGPSINQALALIDSLKRWEGSHEDGLTLYLQDDIGYSKGWLEQLVKMFFVFEQQHKLGFASGIECVEHPVKKILSGRIILKDWIRATCMLARHSYWMSMWPISRIDPETGRERGKPNDGLGSSVDWWFIRNHQNSVCRTGRTNLVIPGLLQHIGYKTSTWLARELPESEEDKKKITGHHLLELTRISEEMGLYDDDGKEEA